LPLKEKKNLRVVLISLGIPVALFVYYKLTWGSVGAFVTAIDHCEHLFCDFVNHYYPMAKTFFTTHTPVTGYFYTSFFALFLTLFSFFSPADAVVMWGILQGIVTLLLFLFPALYFIKRSKVQYLLYLFLFFSSFPVLHNFKWGQVSIGVTLCVIGAFSLYKEDRKFWPAVLLALSFSIKFYTGVFFIYFLIKKDFRFIAVFLAAVIVFMMVLPSISIGIEDNIGFYKSVNQAIDSSRAWISQDANSQYAANVITRVLPLPGITTLYRVLLVVTGYIIFGVNIYLIFRLTRGSDRDERWWAFFLLFVSLPFVLETSWSHYFVYLPFCHVFLFAALRGRNGGFWLKAIQYLFLGVSMVSASIFFFNFIGRWYAFADDGYLFFSNLLLLIVFYSLHFRQGKKAENVKL